MRDAVLNGLIVIYLTRLGVTIDSTTEGDPVANTRRFTSARKNHCSVEVRGT